MSRGWRLHIATFLGAIAFYTCVPIPQNWQLNFQGIARWVPVVGLLIGGMLGIVDWGLAILKTPLLLRSVAIVLLGIGITGGLHLDGAMDTADGLAVPDPERRLSVMTDSRTGAFGVMAAIAIVLLKVAALANISVDRSFVMMGIAGWARWGQLMAIACYPYLKAEGKGLFHKTAIRSPWESLPTGIMLVGFSALPLLLRNHATVSIQLILGGSAIALLTGAWFNYKLGGHTGDTYGATVEWTEALLLGLLAIGS
jgi:adenosylcobinamide-GDP ribazoletransferase